MNAIECIGISKTYPHFNLSDVDLTLPEGAVMGFVGPNGAGKSTTLRIIMGLVHQDAGQVRVLGHEMPTDQVAAKWDIGFVSEDMRLYGHRTIGFHLDFLRRIFASWDDSYATELLRRFDLKPEQKVKGLSHGQRVKAALLTVFARRPKLLVFDEPTTGLDPVARKIILEEMMRVMADETRSILFSSHNTLDVEQISDHITFINQGRIVASHDKETFLDSWRRLRLVVEEGFELPHLPQLVDSHRSGHQLVVTLSDYGPALEAKVRDTGAMIKHVERLTLEEIFIASVEASETGSMAVASAAPTRGQAA
ncbi:MAG: ABC transporter ATP-binding protein [Pseudomonadales bacterium]